MNRFWTALALAGASFLAPVTTQAEPVKIAVIETLSGGQAAVGKMFLTAINYGLIKLNDEKAWPDGIKILEYDNQGGPSEAADKVKAAINDGAHIIVQGASSAIGGQITDDVRKHNLRNPGKEIVYINVGAEAMELTGDKCNFYHFRFSGNAEVRVKALVAAMKQANALGTRVYSINQNYSWGQDMEKAIVDNATVGGYQVVERTLHDVNKIQDFSPYVSKISAAKADTVVTGNWSNDLLLLMKASKAAGLKVRFGTVFLDQPGNLANAGDTAIGHFVVHTFNPEAGGADGQSFVNDYKAKTGHIPVFVEPQTVFGLQMVADALRRTKPEGGALNVNSFAKALESAKVKTPVGEMTMRASDHQALLPMVVSVVSKDAKFKGDETDIGFKPVKVFSAEEAATPAQASCKMARPS
jgi:branched-chain amino acid transport system substrate-binding protein